MENGDERRVVHQFAKNTHEAVEVALTTYRGKPYLDLRVMFENASGERLPTRKGLTLSTDLIGELEASVANLRSALSRSPQFVGAGVTS